MGSGDFIRVRVGIGRPPGRMNPSDYVLGAFSKSEREEIEFSIDKAADAVDYIIANGIEKAMNEFNRKEAD
jgi:PTH1 family peptidyl-tRNA hydrolase